MKIICPNCKIEIPENNININSSLAQCKLCNSVFKLEELTVDQTTEIPSLHLSSRLIVENTQENGFIIKTPIKGLQKFDFFGIPFTITCMGIGLFLLIGKNQNILSLLFLIFFVLLAFSMFIRLISIILEKQYISITNGKVVITNKRFILTKRREISIDQIHSIQYKQVRLDNLDGLRDLRFMLKLRTKADSLQVPAIIQYRRTDYFAEDLNDFEQMWIINFLNVKLRQMKI